MKTFEEMQNDPVLGRVFRDIADSFRSGGVEQGTEQKNNGNNGSSGMPTGNARARDITQDRPNPNLPTYTLATPTPTLASEQKAIKDTASADLSWHRDLKETIALAKEGMHDKQAGKEQASPQPTQEQQHNHTRESQSRGR